MRTAEELLREHRPEAIFVTMSPFTAAEAGIELKRRTGLPLIFDLRDPWALDETKVYPTRWHAWRDWKSMGRALAAADLVIMNTPESAKAAREAFALPATARLVSLTNGYDGEDFAQENAGEGAVPDTTVPARCTRRSECIVPQRPPLASQGFAQCAGVRRTLRFRPAGLAPVDGRILH